jgi:hypothetical protein
MNNLKLLTEKRATIIKNLEYALKHGKNDNFLFFNKQLDEIDSKIEKIKKIQESTNYPYYF